MSMKNPKAPSDKQTFFTSLEQMPRQDLKEKLRIRRQKHNQAKAVKKNMMHKFWVQRSAEKPNSSYISSLDEFV